MVENINVKLGFFLKNKRIYNRISGKKLAEKLNISQQQISRYERGKINFSINFLVKYISALDIPPYEIYTIIFPLDYVLGGTEELPLFESCDYSRKSCDRKK